MPNPDGRPRALITGASSGIGAAFAAQLAENGYDLALVARRKERLDSLADSLRARHSAQSEVLPADLSQSAAVTKLGRWAADNHVDLLINNAGFPGYRPFVELDPSVADDLLSLHVRTVTMLTRAVLPGMVKRHRGAVINVASLLSLSGTIPANPMPYRAVYAGAKSYVLTFTQALAGELRDSGVRLQALLPGVVATEFHDALGMDRSRLESMAMKPEQVVMASLTALETGELVCVPGLDDLTLIENLGKAQRAVLEAANRPQLAPRYHAAARTR
jgi:uncharacterized protein